MALVLTYYANSDGNIDITPTTIETDRYDDVNQIFDDVILNGIPFYKQRNFDGTWPDTIAQRLGVSYSRIEAWRRSDDFHKSVDEYTDNPVVREKLKMNSDGRKKTASGNRTINIKIEVPDGFVIDNDRTHNIISDGANDNGIMLFYVELPVKKHVDIAQVSQNLKEMMVSDPERFETIMSEIMK